MNGRICRTIWGDNGYRFIWYDYFICVCKLVVTGTTDISVWEWRNKMQELIREYGGALLSAIVGMFAVGLLVYAYFCIAAYMEFFADRLMGGWL